MRSPVRQSMEAEVGRHRPLVCLAAVCVGVFGSLGVVAENPRIWSPFPLVTGVPLMLAEMIVSWVGFGYRQLRPLAYVILLLMWPPLFVAWNRQLLRGEKDIPRRSLTALVIFTMLTVLVFIADWDQGVRHQGRSHAIGVLMLNISSLAACWTLLSFGLNRPSFLRSLLFHWITAVWLAWLAFPWLDQFI